MADPIRLIRKGLELITSLQAHEANAHLVIESLHRDGDEDVYYAYPEGLFYKGHKRWAIRFIEDEELKDEETLSVSDVIRYFQAKAPLISEIYLNQQIIQHEHIIYCQKFVLFEQPEVDIDLSVVSAQPSLMNNIRSQPPGGPLRRVPNKSRPRNSVTYRGAGVNYLNAKRRFNDARSSY